MPPSNLIPHAKKVGGFLIIVILLLSSGCVSSTASIPVAGSDGVTPTFVPTLSSPLAPAPTNSAPTPTPTTLIPTPSTPTPTPTTSIPTPTTTPTTQLPTPLPPRADFGLQIHLHREDLALIIAQLRETRSSWVKTQVSWKVFEPQPGVYDENLFYELDQLVQAADEAGLNIMLGVAKAPEWSRPTTEMDGPPGDYGRFANFLALLASRYQGRVDVYELWNEGNLQREWNGAALSGGEFTRLVAVGAAAVRTADPAALIISGAPAPTGINDGITAIDDRVYLQQAMAAGLADHVDGFGIHPYGWGNPPDSTLDQPADGVLSHNDHPSFFFLETIEDYKVILQGAGVDITVKQLWSTEFGWGTTDGFGAEPVLGAEFMRYVNETQQAGYTLRALEIGAADPALGPMILWNLNFAPTFGTDFSESAYSILRPDGSQRPVYEALKNGQ